MTIIEILVAIAMLVALVAVLLPVLSGSRRGALAAETQSRLRQHGVVFASYAIDWKDCYPLPAVPGRETQTIVLSRSGRTIEFPAYFTGSMHWHTLMCESYYQSEPENPVFYPAEHSSRWGFSDNGGIFWMPCVFLAAPDYWHLETRTGPEQHRAVRTSEVQHGDRKILLASMHHVLEDQQANRDQTGRARPGHIPLPFVACDGNVRTPKTGQVLPGMPSADGNVPGAFHLFEGWPGMHTLRGVRGRDVQ